MVSSPSAAEGITAERVPGTQLVYLVDGDDIVILQALFHYS